MSKPLEWWLASRDLKGRANAGGPKKAKRKRKPTMRELRVTRMLEGLKAPQTESERRMVDYVRHGDEMALLEELMESLRGRVDAGGELGEVVTLPRWAARFALRTCAEAFKTRSSGTGRSARAWQRKLQEIQDARRFYAVQEVLERLGEKGTRLEGLKKVDVYAFCADELHESESTVKNAYFKVKRKSQAGYRLPHPALLRLLDLPLP